jgi:hypothetical protein
MFANNLTPASSSTANKKFLLLFFICCALPFVAAKFALEFSWFSAGATNKGQWLEREIQVLPPSNQLQPHWRLVYVQAKICDASCELALYTMQQIDSGLGRQQTQLNNLLLADKIPPQLTRFTNIQWHPVNLTLPELQNHILIVNQQGVALLRYPTIQDQAHMFSVGKDIRADLRHLMNYDRNNL